MIYKEVYNKLIENAKNRELSDGYYETHHIVPRSEGGLDVVSNLVKLTPREHYIAHKLLFLDNPNNMQRVATFWLMSNQHKIKSGRIYQELKNIFLNKVMGKPKSEEHKNKISQANLGKPKSKKHVDKMKASLPNRKGTSNPNYGKGKPIIIDNKEYINTSQAAKELNIKENTLAYRLKSKSFTNYNYKIN